MACRTPRSAAKHVRRWPRVSSAASRCSTGLSTGLASRLARPTRLEPLLPLTLVCAGALLPIMPPLGLALLSPHRQPVAIGRRIPPRGDARSQRLARSLGRRALQGFNAATHAPRSRYRASRSTHSPSVMFSNGLSNGVPKGRFFGGKTRSDPEQVSFCRCGPILAALDPCPQAPSNTRISCGAWSSNLPLPWRRQLHPVVRPLVDSVIVA
jgi:hypothetical protein